MFTCVPDKIFNISVLFTSAKDLREKIGSDLLLAIMQMLLHTTHNPNIYANAQYYANGDSMKRYTVAIPDDLKKEIDALPDINWTQVAKESLEKKIHLLEEFEKYERSRGN